MTVPKIRVLVPSLLVVSRMKSQKTKRIRITKTTKEVMIRTIRTRASISITTITASILKAVVTALCAAVLPIKRASAPIAKLSKQLTVLMVTIWILLLLLTTALRILVMAMIRACKAIKMTGVVADGHAARVVGVAVHAVAALEEAHVVLEAEDAVVTDVVEAPHVIVVLSEREVLLAKTSVMINQSEHVPMTKTAKTTRAPEMTRPKKTTVRTIRAKTTRSVRVARIRRKRVTLSQVQLRK
jgi:hypothetical protein